MSIRTVCPGTDIALSSGIALNSKPNAEMKKPWKRYTPNELSDAKVTICDPVNLLGPFRCSL